MINGQLHTQNNFTPQGRKGGQIGLPGFNIEIQDKRHDLVAMGSCPTNHLCTHKDVIKAHK
jgi:hypothetical protein